MMPHHLLRRALQCVPPSSSAHTLQAHLAHGEAGPPHLPCLPPSSHTGHTDQVHPHLRAGTFPLSAGNVLSLRVAFLLPSI